MMDLKISSIAEKGTPNQERLVFNVLADTDVGEYVVFRTAENAGVVTTKLLNAFWFPDKPVKAGDLVVLYSKGGVRSEKLLKSGRTAYFFYWNAGPAIWGEDGVAAVLLHVDRWNSHLPKEE